MASEVFSDVEGAEDTGRDLDYPEPDAEPLCWSHHSNSCGCDPQDQQQDLAEGEYRFSTESPFPSGWRRLSNDLETWPLW
ncbi:hypothetical protein GCM10010218_12840 [Streptomyces mashuensis]|uniref:Uncharacterized protein n=1 Tax=Streptomyces mashuensis TaxID=33904 RepID=A0A919EBC6_9ACTN|nr:hypothetical protein [Streptomyces mashuensis]GHF33181.1 hypothetical protein GCM10010218_12840 [Streptomyces mashuensis]